MTTPKETSLYQTLPLSGNLELRRRFMVLDEPLQGNLRFGLLLEILDKVAEETALRYVNRFYPTGNHRPVPPVYPTTYAEDSRYLAAHRSYQAIVAHHSII